MAQEGQIYLNYVTFKHLSDGTINYYTEENT